MALDCGIRTIAKPNSCTVLQHCRATPEWRPVQKRLGKANENSWQVWSAGHMTQGRARAYPIDTAQVSDAVRLCPCVPLEHGVLALHSLRLGGGGGGGRLYLEPGWPRMHTHQQLYLRIVASSDGQAAPIQLPLPCLLPRLSALAHPPHCSAHASARRATSASYIAACYADSTNIPRYQTRMIIHVHIATQHNYDT